MAIDAVFRQILSGDRDAVALTRSCIAFLLCFTLSTLVTVSARAAPNFEIIANLISRLHIAHPPTAIVPRDSIEALQTFLQELDPYSAYLSPDEFAYESNTTDSVRHGLGGLVTQSHDGLILIPFIGGPAYAAGIRRPVQLIAIVNRTADKLSLSVIRDLLANRGRVDIKARDLVTGKRVTATVPIHPFYVPPVETLHIGGRKIVRLHVFAQHRTLPALREALQDAAQTKGPLVIDLRYATGGTLYEALDSVSLILSHRVPIATLVNSNGRTVTFRARADQGVVSRLVYLLIGPNTTSSAEVFARALHYYGYAVLVGQTSFGKCVTQQLVELPSGGGLKLTVGRILDPAGVYCNGQGIEPDIRVTSNIHDTVVLLRLIEQHKRAHQPITLGSIRILRP